MIMSTIYIYVIYVSHFYHVNRIKIIFLLAESSDFSVVLEICRPLHLS